MAGKGAIGALFMVFILVVAALSGMARADSFMEEYRKCFRQCHSGCESEGNGNTFCEMKCDTDCLAKEAAAKLKGKH
ncbi:hypothetical protein MLD38_027319 [Melastoma candidum]|uniref:Uncharacterized protein n=1 Tax=Melastoma candidum TaxID=119954 RepID=A0ACB9P1E4_9MYRT|nr:hypothetical protein MLD38_027319 [Melastoma candidum]